MAHVLIIGAGGVSNVVVHKCAEASETFQEITLASRTLKKCNDIAQAVKKKYGVTVKTREIDADNVGAMIELIEEIKPDLVMNIALPYQDLHIMDACLATGVDYLDTANYEPPEEAKFEYKWQWAYQERFKEKGIMALLGSGFDPGVTNVFTAYIKKHLLDEIHELDIIDANAGDHGLPFATNFNPEINIREVTAEARHWEDGDWVVTPALSNKRSFDFPAGIGEKNIYMMYHEELESLVKHFPEIKQARFWMTFSDNYLNHLKVLENVGMTGIEPVMYEGKEIIPIQFLRAVLPDPASLGPRTKGKTCIGCVAKGVKDGQEKTVYVYNICDHEACYAEVGSQAISYTTGVPAMVGAKMMLEETWQGDGVFNMEQFDPDPFLEALSAYGLPWQATEL
ncbi:saccharopine dehydrogenase family protein [Suttonella sp. R2A3]|uniref:saccharopine dehydrogenase family protein n=1 Tax=Suttonella sp. R2A3 TaxID=2908648 RepID=UPI001F274B27|nr:saccharopine dehydrogenase family protein [Suttonella sp. R2A3]UJF25047.1 saccharopine dehydrogenase family protein [Suttonella sp. R2A3]